jgi:hypothetical protein
MLGALGFSKLHVTIVALVTFLPATIIAGLPVHGTFQDAAGVGEKAGSLDTLHVRFV